MNLSKRLRSIEHARDGETGPGTSIASQREASRILRDHPDLQLVTPEDCEKGWEGECAYTYILKLRALAAGDHRRAAQLTNLERYFREKDAAGPEVPAERLHMLALCAGLHARARFEMGKRRRKGSTAT